ncbi:MAG: hypothetical protein DRP71_08715 [Verrucomicrobia bacterium]|nr:MAG: hypothetical protein DRP71_08715 [Verrucomicrobiota bacterium]
MDSKPDPNRNHRSRSDSGWGWLSGFISSGASSSRPEGFGLPDSAGKTETRVDETSRSNPLQGGFPVCG